MNFRGTPKRARGPDWLLFGVLAGITLLTGAAAFAMVTQIWTDKKPAQKKDLVLTPLLLIERPILPQDYAPELPAPDVLPASPAQPVPADPKQPPKPPPIQRPSTVEAPSSGSTAARRPAPEKPDPPPKPQTPPQAAPAVSQQWRVVATSKASAFNLGGHIDKSGVVGSLASRHLRDALKAHRNFGRLPPHLRTHIETENIDLRKLAPYRALVGIDDARLEVEQGVRFERVVASR